MSGSIKFMTYNVWSREHIAVYRRIHGHGLMPSWVHVAFCLHNLAAPLQVTDYIYRLFQEAPWWEKYRKFSSGGNYTLPFDSNPPPSFCLVLSKLDAGEVVIPEYDNLSSPAMNPSPPRFPRAGVIPDDLLSAWVYTKRHCLRAATCRLTSPSPSFVGSMHRRARASAFLEHFDAVHQPKYEWSFVLDGNFALGGDLGWDDDLDGPLRLGHGGWVDAWLQLRGGDAGGWTYHAEANQMLMGLDLPAERRRPDRFICKLRDFTLGSIQVLGVEPIPGVTRFDDKGDFVPVLPSHHFGLLLTIRPKHN